MRVLKFGGTSLANPERFSQAAQLIEKLIWKSRRLVSYLLLQNY